MTRPLRIFCVDDDADILGIIILSLGLDPLISVQTASSGTDALEQLSRLDDAPDCILLDAHLADMTGNALLARIRELPAHFATPVIFLTADVMQDDGRGKADGACGMITKPFDPLTLASAVRRLLC